MIIQKLSDDDLLHVNLQFNVYITMLSVIRHPKLVLFCGISVNPTIILWDSSSFMDTLSNSIIINII